MTIDNSQSVPIAPLPTAPLPTAPLPTAPALLPTAPLLTAPLPTAPVPAEPRLLPIAGPGLIPIAEPGVLPTAPCTRRGPKPKTIKDRNSTLALKAIKRAERTWSQGQKIRVLVFLYHHRIPAYNINTGESYLRHPTQEEASEIFGVPQRTICNWVQKQEEIEKLGFASGIRSRRTEAAVICKWPELETRLYNLFLSRRENGQPIRRGWFRIYSAQIFREIYPDDNHTIFRFSNGWFEAFLRHFRVSLRCITKKAQKIPEDYQVLVIDWIQFNRHNSQIPGGSWIDIMLNRALGRFLLSNICNLDETPLPFEYLNGRTYEAIGARTVWVKETRSGWDKRQPTLVLCIFADGINRIPPLIIFHGTGKGSQVLIEALQYHPGVIVEFNEEAYMNDQLFLKYIEQHLLPTLGGRPTLFAMDHCTSHKTPAVLEMLRNNNVVPSLIPAGCTSLLQPLDISINKPLKDKIRDLTDEAIVTSNIDKWTVRERRILTTWCVGDAWYEFALEKADIIRRSFRNVGLSLAVDGSEDNQLDIKGFDGIEVGDWRRRDDGGGNRLNQYEDVAFEHDNNEYVEFVAYRE